MKRVLLANKTRISFAVPSAFRRYFLSVSTLVFFQLFHILLYAQHADSDPDSAYRKVIHDRVVKIVNTIGLTDSAKYHRVVKVISDQYFTINSLHEQRKEKMEQIKKQGMDGGPEAIKKEEETAAALLKQRHDWFITELKKDLSEGQLEKVKDGMTYRVLPVTWGAYQDMIPSLTQVQKDKMYNWLVEARELAMDAESSEKKHAVFGKYKGRINNYLSAEGYDMKKEEKAWQARIRERAEKNKGEQH